MKNKTNKTQKKLENGDEEGKGSAEEGRGEKDI